MLEYKLHKDPYDMDETLFTGRLTRSIEPGFTVLVGCNGSGKTTILHAIKSQNKGRYKMFSWDGLVDKRFAKERAMDLQNYELLSSLAFSSEGEEINLNIGVLVNTIGHFVRKNADKDIVILLDGLDSGLSIDNIIEAKDFFKELLIPDVEAGGHNCYVIVTANEYELANGELCIDARTGKTVRFKDYEEYRDFILKSRKVKDRRSGT